MTDARAPVGETTDPRRRRAVPAALLGSAGLVLVAPGPAIRELYVSRIRWKVSAQKSWSSG